MLLHHNNDDNDYYLRQHNDVPAPCLPQCIHIILTLRISQYGAIVTKMYKERTSIEQTKTCISLLNMCMLG